MSPVFICSPYSGDINANVLYARAAMRHSLLKGEAPYAPHLLYTQPQVLNDSNKDERKIGMSAGHGILIGCHLVAVYYDRGISQGMMEDMKVAAENGIVLDFRSLMNAKEVSWFTESQDRGITSMWLDEQARVEVE